MKRLLFLIPLFALVAVNAAPDQRGPVSTTPLSRQFLTNDTAAGMRSTIGVSGGGGGGSNTFDTTQFTIDGANQVSLKDGAALTNLAVNGMSVTNPTFKGLITVDTSVTLSGGSGRTYNFLVLSNAQTVATLGDASNIVAAATSGGTPGLGTVTSVGMSLPSALFNSPVIGSPVTSSGLLAPALANQLPRTFFAAPATGSSATPTFRSLAALDIPNLTNIIHAGQSTNVTQSAHFGPSLLSLTNIEIGTDMSDGVNSHTLTLGSSIGIPDKGGLWWLDGGQIVGTDNAHSEDGTGGLLHLVHPSAIAFTMGGGSNPRPFFQFGTSGNANEIFLMQYNDSQGFGSIAAGYTPRSKVMKFVTQTGDASLQGIGGNTNQFVYGELWFWSGDADQTAIGGANAHFNGRMLTNGWEFRGRQVNGKATGSAGSTCVLDFNSEKCVDLTASATAITFYATNQIGQSTNYEQRVFIVRGQSLTPALTFPSGWTWLTSVPTTIAVSNLLRLNLESVGPGETNILASATSGTDNTYNIDSAASTFFTRANITNSIAKNAVAQLVSDLKAASLWNNFTNGFIYPFAGTGSTNNAVNLVRDAYTIAWTGPIGSTNGVTGDGATSFGDTGFNPSSAPAGWSNTNVIMVAYAATNNHPANSSFVLGGTVTTFSGIAYGTTGGGQFWTGIGPNGVNIVAGVDSTAINLGFGVSGFMATDRTNSTFVIVGSGGGSASASFTAQASDNGNIYVLARDNIAAANFFGGTLKFAAMGSPGLSVSQMATLETIVSNFEVAMGRSGMTQ